MSGEAISATARGFPNRYSATFSDLGPAMAKPNEIANMTKASQRTRTSRSDTSSILRTFGLIPAYPSASASPPCVTALRIASRPHPRLARALSDISRSFVFADEAATSSSNARGARAAFYTLYPHSATPGLSQTCSTFAANWPLLASLGAADHTPRRGAKRGVWSHRRRAVPHKGELLRTVATALPNALLEGL